MTRATTFALYLYSTRNIVGCSLAILGLAAYFGGLIDQWWLPICLGLYAAGALAVPSRELIDVSHYQRYDGLRLVEGVRELIKQCEKKLPSEALEVLRSIPAVLEPLLPRLTGVGHDGKESPVLQLSQIQTVRRALTSDLPETVAGYLRLPPVFATVHKLEAGKTAKELLVEQLHILRSQLEKISMAAYSDDAEALINNGQYLKEKFQSQQYLR